MKVIAACQLFMSATGLFGIGIGAQAQSLAQPAATTASVELSQIQHARAWEARMQALFPDVNAGDRITGICQPGVGARFAVNGKSVGEVRDTLFAKLFFGIWLSPRTSEPAMRCALAACS